MKTETVISFFGSKTATAKVLGIGESKGSPGPFSR